MFAALSAYDVIDDRIDLNHGATDTPRLDFAVQARGPVAAPMEQAVRAMWSRSWFGHDWQQEMRTLLRTERPVHRLRGLMQQIGIGGMCWMGIGVFIMGQMINFEI